MSESKRRVGIAQISHPLIAELLHFPAEHRILNVRPGPLGSDYFEVLVDGPTLPESDEGQHAPEISIICTQELGEPAPEKKITTRFEAR